MGYKYDISPRVHEVLKFGGGGPLELSEAIHAVAFECSSRKFAHLVARHLSSPDTLVREEAVLALVGSWRLATYVDDAIRMLRAEDELVRSAAARALGRYSGRGGERRAEIVRELSQVLRGEESTYMQSACYKAILTALGAYKIGDVPEADHFDRQRDVDWERIEKYLDSSEVDA